MSGETLMKPVLKMIGGAKIWVRPGTSDERCALENLEQQVYRRKTLGFEVLPGETWLDLGANIGAFAVYCRQQGATAVCYEPEPGCFRILERNAGRFKCFPYAVTNQEAPSLEFSTSPAAGDFYRGTVLPMKRYQQHEPVLNLHASQLVKFSGQKKFDGIKMDIEGSEGPILDEDLLPRSSKLVMEYHSSRDHSPENLSRRLKVLRKRYKHLHYPEMFDKAIAAGNEIRPMFDRFIFAWGLK